MRNHSWLKIGYGCVLKPACRISLPITVRAI
jgi:hypothetical protein